MSVKRDAFQLLMSKTPESLSKGKKPESPIKAKKSKMWCSSSNFDHITTISRWTHEISDTDEIRDIEEERRKDRECEISMGQKNAEKSVTSVLVPLPGELSSIMFISSSIFSHDADRVSCRIHKKFKDSTDKMGEIYTKVWQNFLLYLDDVDALQHCRWPMGVAVEDGESMYM